MASLPKSASGGESTSRPLRSEPIRLTDDHDQLARTGSERHRDLLALLGNLQRPASCIRRSIGELAAPSSWLWGKGADNEGPGFRAELLDIMVAKVPAGVAQFGKRLVRYEVDESKSSE